MRTVTLWMVVLAATALAAAQSGNGQEAAVRGQVVSADDPPAGIVRVRITPGGAGVRTASFVLSDDRGQFQVMAPRAATLTFSKNGFLPVTVRVAAGAAAGTPLTVTLVRAGVVGGRILDAEGQPVVGGGVRAWRSDSSPGTSGRSVVTAFSNDLGEFRIGGLAAGRYEISSYHDFDEQERLRVSDELREQRINLSPRVIGEAQALSGITTIDVAAGGETQVTLQQSTKRAGAFPTDGSLSGTVIDEFGEPVERMRVRAWRVPSALGGTARQTGAAATTDDRGQFRLFHLPPGPYVIEVSNPNQPASTSLAPVYYPGTNVIGLASLVPLDTGQAVTNLTIPYLPSALPSVHGMAIDAAGRPLRGVVGLMPAGSANGVRAGARTTQPAADGSFAFSNVAPGEYVVRATGLGVDDPRTQLFMSPSEFGMQRIVVGDGNVGPLRLSATPTARITGRFEFEGTPPPSATEFIVQPVSADPERTPDRARPLVTPPPTNRDGTFEIRGLTGMTTLRLTGAPAGWWLKEIRGSTTLSPMQPFDPAVDSTLVLVLSNESARVLGRVVQNADAPGAATVLLFSTDERHWRNGSPFVRRVRATEQRSFAISTVPPGEYFVAAVADADLTLDDDEMPAVLGALSRVALRITVAAGEEQRHELRPAVIQR